MAEAAQMRLTAMERCTLTCQCTAVKLSRKYLRQCDDLYTKTSANFEYQMKYGTTDSSIEAKRLFTMAKGFILKGRDYHANVSVDEIIMRWIAVSQARASLSCEFDLLAIALEPILVKNMPPIHLMYDGDSWRDDWQEVPKLRSFIKWVSINEITIDRTFTKVI